MTVDTSYPTSGSQAECGCPVKLFTSISEKCACGCRLGKALSQISAALSPRKFICDATRFFCFFLKMFIVKKFQICREIEQVPCLVLPGGGSSLPVALESAALGRFSETDCWATCPVALSDKDWPAVSSTDCRKKCMWPIVGQPFSHLTENWTRNLQLILFPSVSTPLLRGLVSPSCMDVFESVMQFGAYSFDYAHHLSFGEQDSAGCFLTSPLTTTTRAFLSSNLS